MLKRSTTFLRNRVTYVQWISTIVCRYLGEAYATLSYALMSSKFIKLYALKSATTKACLNKLVNHYFGTVIAPKVILSDNGTQFRPPSCDKQLQKHGVETRFTPIRHPQSNPSERHMQELWKFCRIYCNEIHKKWGELLPYIEN